MINCQAWPAGQFDSNFDQWFGGRFGDSPAGAIRMTEDQEYVYYTLDIGSANSEKVDIAVEGNVIEITADLGTRIERKEADQQISSIQSQTIHQRFPVPPGTDPASIKIEQPKGSVVVRFTKLKG